MRAWKRARDDCISGASNDSSFRFRYERARAGPSRFVSDLAEPSGDHPLTVHSGALDHDRGLAWVTAQHRERRGDRVKRVDRHVEGERAAT
jgi:hypothetical protein